VLTQTKQLIGAACTFITNLRGAKYVIKLHARLYMGF